MGWQEVITNGGWSLTYQGATYWSSGTSLQTGYIGDGTRVFVELSDATGDLPDIGDNFENVYESGKEYTGITCDSIQYAITHHICTSGRTATLHYTSKPTEYSYERAAKEGIYTCGLKTIAIDQGTDWAWYTDNDTTGGTGAPPSDGAYVGRVAQTLYRNISTIEFEKRITVDKSDLSNWISKFNNMAGKVNSAEFEGFAVGNVLLSSATARLNTHEKYDIDIRFQVQLIQNIGESEPHDCWNFMPSNMGGNYPSFLRPVRGERSEGMGTGTGSFDPKEWIYNYADLEDILDAD